MSDCQATTATWKDKTLHVCEACNIRTLSADALASRCQAATAPPQVVSTVLGPDGEPAEVEPREVGGGWYEIPGGERVQGIHAAREAMGDPTAHDDI